MGLAERDYMRDRRTTARKIKKDPPTLYVILVWLCLAFLTWKGADWFLERKRLSAISPVVVPQTENQAPPQQAPPKAIERRPTIAPYPPQAAQPSISNQQIVKCSHDGKTSYSNTPCPSGAMATHIQIREAPAPPVTVQTTPPNPPSVAAPTPVVIAQNPLPQPSPVDSYAMKKAECLALEEDIKQMDSWARQPNSGQTQDFIRERRKKARDRQFEIRC